MRTSLWAILFMICVLPGGRSDGANYDELEYYLREHFYKGLESPVQWRWSWKKLRSSSIPWISMYLPSPESNSTSEACKDDLRLMALALEGPGITWPMRMVDSWGKFSDGMLWGNIVTQGSFDQCLAIKYHSEEADIKGKYCTVFYERKSSQEVSSKLLRRNDDTLGAPRIAHVTAMYPVMLELAHGTCMPNHCTDEDLKASVADTIEGELLYLDVICHTDEDQHQFDAADIFFITLLAILLALMLSAAVIDVYIDLADKQDWRKGPLKYLLVFSLSTNFRKLFHIPERSAPGTITCLHGIRVLSMCWVVYGHQHILNLYATENIFALDQKTDGLLFQIFGNALVSVDTFFFMSGLLVTYGVMRELQRTGRFDVIIFYVHRLIRLTPPIAIIVGLNATIIRFLAIGPFYSASAYSDLIRLCREEGWKDILYVNNFLGFDEENNWLDCVGQCWYTAVDMQLFLVSPLLLLPLYFYPRIGEGLLYVFSLASVLTPAIITVVGDFPPEDLMTLPMDESNHFNRHLYVTPWCRAGSWVVGLWTGYAIFKQKQKFTMKPWQVVAGWTFAVFTSLASLFGVYGYVDFVETLDYDVMTQFFYGGFHRAAWAMAVAWVVFACHNGYGGIVNSFLSYPAWQPLSRLTYAMFLISPVVQTFLADRTKSLFYFNSLNKILETCGTLFVTGIVSIFLSLSVESPILGLEKLIFRKPGSPTKTKSPDEIPLHSRL